MKVTQCTIRENGHNGVLIDALPAIISGCHIANNGLDGILLEWPIETRVKGSGA
jgi:hypothetical protein